MTQCIGIRLSKSWMLQLNKAALDAGDRPTIRSSGRPFEPPLLSDAVRLGIRSAALRYRKGGMSKRYSSFGLFSVIGMLYVINVAAQDLPFPPDYLQQMGDRLARCSGVERVMVESSRDRYPLASWLPTAAGKGPWVRGFRAESDEHAEAASRFFTSWLVATEAVTSDVAAAAAMVEEIAAIAAAETRSALAAGDRREFFDLIESCIGL